MYIYTSAVHDDCAHSIAVMMVKNERLLNDISWYVEGSCH